MHTMVVEALYPKPILSTPHPDHRIYPYRLRGVAIETRDQVWGADIPYRFAKDFSDLVAVMDWYSRYVLAWELSTSLEAGFCIQALERALTRGTPEIFNTNQGAHLTSRDFTQVLLDAAILIRMDGRGRCMDNIFTERLWRSLKYEEVYLKDYQTVREARYGIDQYFTLYNTERLHQALGYLTPSQVYYGARN
jgi:putative transposase